MTDNRGNQTIRHRRESERYDIDGNTARRLRTQSDTRRRERERYEARRIPRYENEARPVKAEIRHEKRESAYDLMYTVFLMASVGITLLVCIVYMYANTRLTKAEQSVAVLQSQLQEIQEQNTSLQESLSTTIDLNEVYRIATKRMGMVYPDEDQIIYYDSSNSDYVRQYESIPGKNQ